MGCRWMPWRMLWKSALAEFSPTAAISWGKHPSNDQKVISKRVLSLQGVFWALALLGKKHTAYSQFKTLIYSIWASTFLLTRNRVQKSCLKLPGVTLVDCVGGDHFMCLNWIAQPPMLRGKNVRWKKQTPNCFPRETRQKKTGLGSGWWVFGSETEKKDLTKLPQQQKVGYHWHYEGLVSLVAWLLNVQNFVGWVSRAGFLMDGKSSTGLVDCGHALRNLVLFTVLADVSKKVSKHYRIRSAVACERNTKRK